MKIITQPQDFFDNILSGFKNTNTHETIVKNVIVSRMFVFLGMDKMLSKFSDGKVIICPEVSS